MLLVVGILAKARDAAPHLQAADDASARGRCAMEDPPNRVATALPHELPEQVRGVVEWEPLHLFPGGVPVELALLDMLHEGRSRLRALLSSS